LRKIGGGEKWLRVQAAIAPPKMKEAEAGGEWKAAGKKGAIRKRKRKSRKQAWVGRSWGARKLIHSTPSLVDIFSEVPVEADKGARNNSS